VFTGEYVTGGVPEEYLQHLENLRADNNRGKAIKLHIESGMDAGMDAAGRRVNGVVGEEKDMHTGGSTPVNGSDDTVGLHNSFNTTS